MNARKLSLPHHWDRNVRSAIIQVASLAHWGIVYARSWAADSKLQRVRLAGTLDRARNEIALLKEEIRIKDARMARIGPHRRPFYPPMERLAVLELKAARGWNLVQTARAFLIEPDTVAEWMKRVDEEANNPLVALPGPVNKYPDFVRHMVRRLKTLCPVMGKKRIADVLAKAGLRLAATTVKRMLESNTVSPPDSSEPFAPGTVPAIETSGHVVTAKYPNHVWHVDLTVVPTTSGFWTAWFPFSLLQVWPFCWWLALIVDHFSRRCVGFAVYRQQPTSLDVRSFLGRATRATKATPRHLISDRGPQFDCHEFRQWARRKKIRLRHGAVGKYGSIAIIERFIRSMKSECFGPLLVPMRLADMRKDLADYVGWFDEHRPHQGLLGRTPAEMVLLGHRPAFETRGKCAVKLKLAVSCFRGRRHLPVVQLQRAA